MRHDFRGDPTIDYATGQDPMVTSDCALEWLDRHPYFNSSLGTSTGDTTIELTTPYFRGSDLVFDFTITDADGLHQAQFFKYVETDYDYRDLNLLECRSLSGSPATVTFRTISVTSENNTVALRVIDGGGRSIEQHFSVDFTALGQDPQAVNNKGNDAGGTSGTGSRTVNTENQLSRDVNKDGTVNIQDLVLVASNLGERGENQADVNRDGVVNILDLVAVASAFGTSVAIFQ